jgi:hypothetical protein
MNGWAGLAAAVAVAVTFCVSGTPPAFAAPDSTPASRDQIEDRRQALLRLMLQDPSNLDVAFEYAALSSQVGDYEAAVSTLERMLIFAPNTCSLRRPNAAPTGTCRRGAGHQYIASFQPFSALS